MLRIPLPLIRDKEDRRQFSADNEKGLRRLARASGFLRIVVFDVHGIGKDNGVWNDDVPSLLGLHDRRASLNVGTFPLYTRDSDEIAYSERLL